MSKKGKIIVIDGMDGCGKATQSMLLYKKLKENNEKVKIFSFPNYESDSSYFVKKLLKGEYGQLKDNKYIVSLFYAMDRCITYHNDIKKYYNEGYTIILDRYYTSNIIYQLPKDNHFSYLKFIKDIEVDKLELPTPDLTIYLVSNPNVSDLLLNKRYNNDENKKDIYENISIQNKVYENIKTIKFCMDNKEDILKVLLGRLEVLYIHDENNNIYSREKILDTIFNLL